MNRISVGIGLALLAAIALLTWLWRSEVEVRAQTEAALAHVSEAMRLSEEEAAEAQRRADLLSESVTSLSERLAANKTELEAARRVLDSVQQEEGDSDESMACLSVDVPAAVDRLLRGASDGQD